MINYQNILIQNDNHARVFFDMEDAAITNVAKNAQSGTWAGGEIGVSNTAKFGSNSLDLDLTSTRRIYTFNSSVNFTEGLYFSLFARLTSTPTATAAAICLFESTNERLYLFADTSRRYKVTAFKSGGVVSDALFSSATSLNTWYFIQAYMTCDNIYMKIGDELVTYTLSACPDIDATDFIINATTDSGNNKYPGLIDSVIVKTGMQIPIATLYNEKNREA